MISSAILFSSSLYDKIVADILHVGQGTVVVAELGGIGSDIEESSSSAHPSEVNASGVQLDWQSLVCEVVDKEILEGPYCSSSVASSCEEGHKEVDVEALDSFRPYLSERYRGN